MKRNTVTKGWLLSAIGIALLGLLLLSGCPKKADTTTGTGGGANSQANAGQQMDPATREKFKKFMEDHKYAVQLMRTTGGIGRLEREGLTPLTSAQAKSILAVLNPLRTKDALSEDDAKAAIKGINAVMTEQQLNALDKMQANRHRGGNGQGGGGQAGAPGGFGGPGAGQGGGQHRQGGNRMHFNTDDKNFNPLNTTKDQERGKHMQEFFDALEQKAKG